jgi:hypothetical protein
MEEKRPQSKLDWWRCTALVVALLCFSFGALAYDASGGRALAQLSIFVGFAALLSFFLRMYYHRSR